MADRPRRETLKRRASDPSTWSREKLEREYLRLRATVLIGIRENVIKLPDYHTSRIELAEGKADAVALMCFRSEVRDNCEAGEEKHLGPVRLKEWDLG